jgi:hypothetical protein
MRSLSNFKSSLEKFGLSHQNRFDILIKRGQGIAKELSYRCESLNVPGIQILTKNYKLYGGQPEVKLPVGRANDEVVVTFIAMKDFRDKNYFEEWLDQISDFSTNRIAYYNTVKADIEIKHYDEEGDDNGPKESRRITLVGAIPNRIEMIQQDWTQTDEILKYSVNFSYESLKIETVGSSITFGHMGKSQSDVSPIQTPGNSPRPLSIPLPTRPPLEEPKFSTPYALPSL